jgi:hypothetical protein
VKGFDKKLPFRMIFLEPATVLSSSPENFRKTEAEGL